MITVDPNFPSSSGRVELTSKWAITLQGVFSSRLTEDSKMNLWRDGMTIWVSAYSGGQQGIKQRLDFAKDALSGGAYEAESGVGGGLGRLTYRQDATNAEGQLVKGLYAAVHGPDAQIMCAFYFNDMSQLADAKAMAATIEYIGEDF